MTERTLPVWAPEAAVAVGVGALAISDAVNVSTRSGHTDWGLLFSALTVGVTIAAAAGLFRRSPAMALVLVWLAGLWQVSHNVPVLYCELAVALVAFGAARYGSVPLLWASGLSIPAGGALALVSFRLQGYSLLDQMLNPLLYRYGAAMGSEVTVLTGAILLGLALTVPWLVGLALRQRHRADVSDAARQEAEVGRDQAEEIARLREDQARLARDVHDVVGHSLAVILAQAESGQFRSDGESQALKQTLADIATSARTSLQDVRQVLSETRDAASTVPPGGLDQLVESVRSSGHIVDSTVIGTPQPLPPELDVVAYRTLQELLTNAIKHGTGTIGVERHWEGDLRIEVTNDVPSISDETVPIAVGQVVGEGQGLTGLRSRLESAGGRLDVRRRGSTFTATAWIPVRPA